MVQKIKEFINSVEKRDVILSLLLLCLVGYVIWTGFKSTKKDLGENPIEVAADYVYEDIVFVVGVIDEFEQVKDSTRHRREVLFSNQHHLTYEEMVGAQLHSDCNHPLYADVEDVCSVRVELRGKKETVTLLRNLSKELLFEMGSSR